MEVQNHALTQKYPTLLAIESSGEICAVALSIENSCFVANNKNVHDHSAVLTLLIEAVLKAAGISSHELQAVALSKGPGSYTSLRIGFATAKGIAFAVGCPLIAVPTLEVLASQIAEQIPDYHAPKALMPMIDARRMEVYTQPYSHSLAPMEAPSAKIFNGETKPFFSEFAPALFGGPGAEKGQEFLEPLGYCLIPNITPSAKALLPRALKRYEQQEFESLAYLEPLYLKEFVAIPSKKPF